MNKLKLTWLILTVFLLTIFTLTTCDTPMGMGDPIDWEAPVITLDPGPNPRYVRLGTIIGGKVTDNIKVDRIIMRDASTGVEYFRGQLLPNDRFQFVLNFNKNNDGDKISVEIAAFDKLGNAAVESLTVIIDLSPPIVETAYIERSSAKTFYFTNFNTLQKLEKASSPTVGPLDPLGEKLDYVNYYQNGSFWLTAKLVENETRVEKVILNIYDATEGFRDLNKPLYTLDNTDDKINNPYYVGSTNSPKWIIHEEELIKAGMAKHGNNYKTKYYDDKERYYYFVSLTAFDKSANTGELKEQVNDQNFFCMWEKADEPKGFVDPIIGSVIYKKMTIPVQFFDDDSLAYAYAGLLSKKQWNGEEPIYTDGSKLTGSDTNAKKLSDLYDRFDKNKPVLNWKYDSQYRGTHSYDPNGGSQQAITNSLAGTPSGTKVYDYLVNIETGDKDGDYGEFMLFTICADTKLNPHDDTYNGPYDTLKSRQSVRVTEINIIDDNQPLIVLDTVNTKSSDYKYSEHEGSERNPITGADQIVAARTGDSPEENTFPTLTEEVAGDGINKLFTINGYTLREKGGATGSNKVQRFRMAWIPDGILTPSTEKDIIKKVENFLRWYKDPSENRDEGKETYLPTGVQYWLMDDSAYASANGYTSENNAPIVTGTEVTIGSSIYVKQAFRKKFSVLYDNDDLKYISKGYKNFTYNNGGTEIQENKTKVFVFCAIDNMQKVVTRTIRLLPNNTPPTLSIYEITSKDITGLDALGDIPDVYTYSSTGAITTAYITARQTYNNNAFNALKSVYPSQVTDKDFAAPFQTYPRKTEVKFYVNASKTGGIAIDSVTMQDVTNSGNPEPLGSSASKSATEVTYIEKFPEVTSRVFLFTAKDKLGNEAQIQRTIAITNAATLRNITTEKLDGTYGIGQTITLKANFDGSITTKGGTPTGTSGNSDIVLNVRYQIKGASGSTTDSDYIYKHIPLARVNGLSLEFDFVVSEGDLGKLETLYNDPDIYLSNIYYNRPITLNNNAQIIDVSRNADAFTPENLKGFTWKNSDNSLQDPKNGKTILLDGIRPKITKVDVSGKTRASDGNYYFKGGETILFTITADKSIRTGDIVPKLDYSIEGSGTYSYFNYLTPSGANKMILSLEVNKTSLPNDGEVNRFKLNDTKTIVDDVGNSVDPSTVSDTAFSVWLSGIKIYNDQTKPSKPVSTLSVAPSTPANLTPATNITIGGTPSTTWYYKTNPALTITSSPSEPYGQTLQYSINGGFSWTGDFVVPTGASASTTLSGIPNGEYTLQTRSTDKAGNIGDITEQKVYVDAHFPSITSVSIKQSKGTYTAATGQKDLTFVLNFENYVRVTSTNPVSITVTNRNSPGNNIHNSGSTLPTSYSTLIPATGQTTNTKSIEFLWTGSANKEEMLDGLYISAIDIRGLTDQFGNFGGTGSASSSAKDTVTAITMAPNSSDGAYTVTNLPSGYIIDTIAPRVSTIDPALNAILTTDPNRKTITLTFNEPMMKGSGIITIKPASDSLIPPVFENYGYYIDVSGNRFTSPGTNRTYVDGFYDVYNNSNLTAADKNALTESTSSTSPSWGTLKLNTRTGQTVGPYQRLTQGLKIGTGYTGNYSSYSGSGPDPQANESSGDTNRFLVPDTTTKWVLDYKLSINDTTNTKIIAISDVLKKANFRCQEIDVANVAINGKEVTITLNQPLLIGLHWELSYPAGTFADEAGNNAPALASHEFWTGGAQTPVIRVNRRSYDARQVGVDLSPPIIVNNAISGTRGQYPSNTNLPGTTTDWNTAGFTVSDTTGWGFDDFKTIHYRIETETPGATLTSGVYSDTAANRRTNRAGVTAAFGGNVYTVNANNQLTDSAWNDTTQTDGTWILSNLIRRANSSYTVTENGNSITRTYSGTYQGFRSYNKDATIANINGVGLSAFNTGQGIVSFDALEAGKSYVVALATRGTQTSARGYEGVFRTVIALYNNGGNYANNGANKAVFVEGSNIKNGMPSISGFPVQDAAESGDSRFVKMFYKYSGTNNAQLVWVSTEIVCEWYFLKYGGNQDSSTHMSDGEVNNYLTVGYGDLSYGYNLRSSNDN